jgi:hypothetical protein
MRQAIGQHMTINKKIVSNETLLFNDFSTHDCDELHKETGGFIPVT